MINMIINNVPATVTLPVPQWTCNYAGCTNGPGGTPATTEQLPDGTMQPPGWYALYIGILNGASKANVAFDTKQHAHQWLLDNVANL